MAIFFERFVLPLLVGVVITGVLVNVFKFDLIQRVSLTIAVIAFALFIGVTLTKDKTTPADRPATKSAPIAPSPLPPATTHPTNPSIGVRAQRQPHNPTTPTGTNIQIATSPCTAQANGGNATVEGCNAGPPPLEIRWSVRDQAGGNDLWKFEKIVTVTPNVEWHPVSVAIHCDQEVKSGMPEGFFYKLQTGFDPTKTILSFYFPNPPQAANTPLSFEIFSDREFNVINVELAVPPPTAQ